MNNSSQCIFDISHVNKNLRDTLEFLLPNPVEVKNYEARRKIIESILDPKTFLGKFLVDNAEKLEKFKKDYQDFIDEVYGEESTVLTKTAEGTIRVDNTQNLVILKGVVYLGETFRDIMFSHLQLARQQHLEEEAIVKFVDADERFDRAIKVHLLLGEYQKSFMEFQKVMNESKGQPSPQSNYIVQNELQVIASMLRFEREHLRFIDNKSLDVYDKVIELIQMCEGRRERRDNKTFPQIFEETTKMTATLANECGPRYNEQYQLNLKDMLATIEKSKENKENAKA